MSDIVGYGYITVQLVFEIKLGDNFINKSICFASGNNTGPPYVLTYSIVVNIYFVTIVLSTEVLNDLSVLLEDVHNTSLTSPNQV